MLRDNFGTQKFALDLETGRLSYRARPEPAAANIREAVQLQAGTTAVIYGFAVLNLLGIAELDFRTSMFIQAAVGFLPVIAFVIYAYWRRVEIKIAHGRVRRVLGRFPPRFEREISVSAFEGVAWWVDDVDEHNAWHMLELRHGDPKMSVALLRRRGGPPPAAEQLEYSHHFGLAALMPPNGTAAIHPRTVDDVSGYDWRRDRDFAGSGKVRVNLTADETTLEYPYKPKGFWNAWSTWGAMFAVSLVGLSALCYLFWSALPGDGAPVNLLNFMNLLFIGIPLAGLLGFAISYAFTRFAEMRRVRLRIGPDGIDTRHAAVGRKRTVISDIATVVEGRIATNWGPNATGALFAISGDAAFPLAYRLDDPTKRDLAAAIAEALARHAKR